MNYLILLLGIFAVIGGFYLSEIYENSRLNIIGSILMLGGLFLTFASLLNIMVPNFFNS